MKSIELWIVGNKVPSVLLKIVGAIMIGIGAGFIALVPVLLDYDRETYTHICKACTLKGDGVAVHSICDGLNTKSYEFCIGGYMLEVRNSINELVNLLINNLLGVAGLLFLFSIALWGIKLVVGSSDKQSRLG